MKRLILFLRKNSFVWHRVQKNQKKVTIGIVEGHKKQRVAFMTDRQSSAYAIVHHDSSIVVDSNRVYECAYDFKGKQFYVVCEQQDKENRPNSLRTANSVWKLLMYELNINVHLSLVARADFKSIQCIPWWQKESLTLKTIVPVNDSVMRWFNRQNGKKH